MDQHQEPESEKLAAFVNRMVKLIGVLAVCLIGLYLVTGDTPLDVINAIFKR